MPERVILVPYDSLWPAAYETERVRLTAALGPCVVAIHHVGSTAIPGMSAKPVLDIVVECAEYPPTDTFCAALAQLGYSHMGESHVPGRHWFRKGAPRTHHVHAVPVGGDVMRRQLALRDWLRTHPDDARAYAEAKQIGAAMFPHDIDGSEYAQAKSRLIEKILARAMIG